MSFIIPLCLLISLSLFVSCNGEKSKLQEHFDSLQGDVAKMRDFCLDATSMTTAELIQYENNNDVPEKYACFFKCWYEKHGIIDEKGHFDVDALADLSAFDKSKFGEVKKCMKEAGDAILTCIDLKNVGKCLDMAIIAEF